MELLYNETIDFIFSLKRFADRNKPFEPECPRAPEVDEWCRRCENKLSPFLLSDFSLIFEKMFLPFGFFFHLYQKTGATETPRAFLQYLKDLSPDFFVEATMKEFTGVKLEDLTREDIYNSLVDNGLHPGYDPKEEATLLYGFLQEPKRFLDKLYQTSQDFLEQAFLPETEGLTPYRESKLAWHKERLNKDGMEYLKHLGIGSFLKDLSEDEKPRLFFSIFSDNEVSTFWMTRVVVIGGNTDKRILSRSARERSEIFFSCLSDPKRLEILRLTAQRPWFSTELANHFDLKPATLSYHMNKLADAGLLNIEKGESKRFYYSLNHESVKEFLGFATQDLLGLNYED